MLHPTEVLVLSTGVIGQPLPSRGDAPARAGTSVDPDRALAVMHTSGTTSAPKPIVLTEVAACLKQHLGA